MREVGRQAIERGYREAYRAILLEMSSTLLADPAAWGDPQFSLRTLGLVVHHRLYWPFCVTYAVDEERRIVYLRTFELLVGAGESPEEKHPG